MRYFKPAKSIKFPKIFNSASKSTRTSTDVESINESLKCLILTSKGELLGDPDYGTTLHNYVFEINNADLLNNILVDELVNDINTYETRIYVNSENVKFKNVGNKLYIEISYLIKNLDSIENTEILVIDNEEDK